MNPQIPTLYGDLIRSDEKVIAHGCNTRGIMGAGIAAQIAQTYPLVLHANQRDVAGGLFPLGAAQLVVCNPKRLVFNLGTQPDAGPCAKLEYIYLAFRNMAERCVQGNIKRVGIPAIGCGLGGLVWPDVEAQITLALAWIRDRGHEFEVVQYVYQPNKPSQDIPQGKG